LKRKTKKTRNKKRYAENIEETRKRLRKNEGEIPEPLLMAVEFGRIEKIDTAPHISEENEDQNMMDLNGEEQTSVQDDGIYRCTHQNCDYDTRNTTKRWRGLVSHMAMHTRVRNKTLRSNGQNTDFNCPYCKRKFKILEKLLRHVEGKKCRENTSTKSNKEKFKEILSENW